MVAKDGAIREGGEGVNPLIEQYQQALQRLCRLYHVRRLELFGSATRDDFGPESDLDFLVEFHELEPNQYADHYFGLREALADLFQRPVDLVMASAVKNPYFLESVRASRAVVYGT